MRRPPRSTLLPYTPLFRSRCEPAARRAVDAAMIDAEARGNATLDPAPLLLGLVANPAAPAVAALDLLGIAAEQVRDAAAAVLAELPAPRPDTIEIDDATEGILARAADLVGAEGRDAVSDL